MWTQASRLIGGGEKSSRDIKKSVGDRRDRENRVEVDE